MHERIRPSLCFLLIVIASHTTRIASDQSAAGPSKDSPSKDSPADSEFYNPIPGEVLTKSQKTSLCAVKRDSELCPAAGTGNQPCRELAASVSGTDARCDVRHVCSFQMAGVKAPAINTTLAPHPAPSHPNEIVNLRREPNRAYVSQENLDDLYIVKECTNNSLVVFVPENLKT